MDVGVRELKAKLSSYLRQAAEGELITVTDHGTPIAVLGPVIGRVDLSVAAEEGWVRPPTRQGLQSVRRHRAAQQSADVLAEDRDQ